MLFLIIIHNTVNHSSCRKRKQKGSVLVLLEEKECLTMYKCKCVETLSSQYKIFQNRRCYLTWVNSALSFIWTKSLRNSKVKIYAEMAETYISTNPGSYIKKHDSVFIWHCKIPSDKETMVWSYAASFERTGYKEHLVSYNSPNHNPCSGFKMWGRFFWETEGSKNVALSRGGQFVTVSVSVWHFLNLLQGQGIWVGFIVDFKSWDVRASFVDKEKQCQNDEKEAPSNSAW